MRKLLDGDTLHYKLEGSQEKGVARLWHIDTFEKQQSPFGEMGKRQLQHLLNFKEESESGCQLAYLKVIQKDRYQRDLVLLKKNSLDHVSINEALVSSGWALIYPGTTWPLHDKMQWQRLEERAKLERKGIWKYDKKLWQKPWLFRRQQRTNS